MKEDKLKEQFEENCKLFDLTTEQGIWALGFAREAFCDHVIDLMNELENTEPGKFRDILEKYRNAEATAYLKFADYVRAVTEVYKEES